MNMLCPCVLVVHHLVVHFNFIFLFMTDYVINQRIMYTTNEKIAVRIRKPAIELSYCRVISERTKETRAMIANQRLILSALK